MKSDFDPRDTGRLLRHRITQHYYTGDGWTPDISQAQPFPNEEEAMRACIANNLEDVEMVVWVPARQTEVAATPVARRV